MGLFSYSGISQQEKVAGKIEAENESDAFQKLKSQGITVSNIKPFQTNQTKTTTKKKNF